MLSGWHVHAKGYGEAIKAMPDAAVTAVWDEEPDRGKEWAAELEAPFEADLAAFLARDARNRGTCSKRRLRRDYVSPDFGTARTCPQIWS